MRKIWLAALLFACGNKSGPVPVQGNGSAGSGSADKPGLVLALSNGTQAAPPVDHTQLAAAQKLADLTALFARTKPIAVDPNDIKAAALRPASQPPPTTGERVTTTFPPPPSLKEPPAATNSTAPLHVVRFMPEGKLDEAPQLTVTFDQPMVAITSQNAAAATQPVTLAPAVKGHWRWIGTRTIVFDPDGGRFPMATTYHVSVAAGTKGVVGAPLDKAVEFTFETPTPKVVESIPAGSQSELDAPMLLVFDQRIDPATVLADLSVNETPNKPDVKDPWGTPKSTPIQLQRLDAAAIAQLHDEAFTQRVAALGKELEGRWVVFRANQKFIPDARIDLELRAGLASAEGPNRTATAQHVNFSTFPPLEVTGNSCSELPCAPSGYVSIQFSNQLDADAFKDDQIEIAPKIPNVHIQVSYQQIVLVGEMQPDTTYKVEIKGSLRDAHHQTLLHDTTVSIPIGPPTPAFWGENGTILVDPLAPKPQLPYFTSVYSGVKVSLFEVSVDDYPAFWRGAWMDPKAKRPGTALAPLVLPATGTTMLKETDVDLSPALANGRGQVVAIVEPSPWKPKNPKDMPPNYIVWAEATHLAIDAHIDQDQIVVYASDLATGAPVADALIELRPLSTSARTDAHGMATIPRPAAHSLESAYLVARHGEDVTLLPGEDWGKRDMRPSLEWHMFDDRDLYRPGEDVSIKGWLRIHDPNRHGDIGGVAGKVTTVGYKVQDGEGNQIASGDAKVNALGGFDLHIKLPATPNLGEALVMLDAHAAMPGRNAEHEIRIEEFRRPEFEATAHVQADPFIVGAGGDVTVGAHYFAGGGLGGAKVTWNLHADETSYRPPNHDDYVFGTWSAWWETARWGELTVRSPRPISDWTFQAKTDAGGEHVLHVDAQHASPEKPFSVRAQATIMDTNNQSWSATTTFIVHPAQLYVGIAAKKPFVEQGEPYELSLIGVDIDGKPSPGAKISVDVVRTTEQWANGKSEIKEVDPQHCDAITAKDAVPCKLATPHGGEYTVRAAIVDAKGRTNRSEMQFWVSGGEPRASSREVSQETVEIIPDKKEYTPGNTAELMIRSPFVPAEGVVTYRRSGIVKTERITLTKPSTVITVPITDDLVPNLVVQVDLVGSAPRLDDHGKPDATQPARPAYAVGSIDLSIPPRERTLAVTVKPSAEKLAPGDKATVTVIVKDAAGKPVQNADVALFVVDDSILTLAGYTIADPLASFYQARPTETQDFYAREYLHLSRKPGEPTTGAYEGWNGDFGASRFGTIGHGYRTGNGYGVGGGRGGMRGRMIAVDKNYKADTYYDLLSTQQEMPDPNATYTRNIAVPKVALAEKKPAPPDEDSDGIPDVKDATTVIAVRSNFNPLALFAPAATTDAEGSVVLPVTMPDNLTRYRVIAVVAAGERQFGKGESTMTARLPLMVRATPPRFLSFGDTFGLPITLQNQTDAAMTVKLGVRVANLSLTDGDGRIVTVPANDHVLVELPAAAMSAGTARIQIVAASGDVADAQELSLPVWTPATTEAFATYGVIAGPALPGEAAPPKGGAGSIASPALPGEAAPPKGGAGSIDGGAIRQPIALPPQVLPQFGGIEISFASTNLQALTDALIYLVRYPYECSEQRSSRILAISGLRDVLAAFHSKDLPSPALLAGSIGTDVEWLVKMQHSDGGFSYWKPDDASDPYLSIYVPFVLSRAKAKGYPVPPQLFARSLQFLTTIDSHIPTTWSKDERAVLDAFAIYTRKLLGNLDVATAKRLVAEKPPVDAAAWLLSTLAGDATATAERATLEQFLAQQITETAGAASIRAGYTTGGYWVLGSDGRSAGLVLDALIADQPKSDLIPKLVTGLLASRKRGHWESTQEDGFVLIALDHYFQTYEKVTPNFVARAWLGSDYAGDHAFRGRTTETASIEIPMAAVATHDKSDLVIQKDGSGRMYYRIGTSYAPADLHIDAADHGFVVERHYEAVDDPKDVTRDASGTWHVKAGARVRVRLSMVNDGQRHHVALVDPMPAGFEAINPELAGTATIPDAETQQRDRYWWWHTAWYEHQNMRDERVEAFAANVWEGVHAYDYVARATTRGTFVAAPPKAEEMYMPETFGRGASERVIVE